MAERISRTSREYEEARLYIIGITREMITPSSRNKDWRKDYYKWLNCIKLTKCINMASVYRSIGYKLNGGKSMTLTHFYHFLTVGNVSDDDISTIVDEIFTNHNYDFAPLSGSLTTVGDDQLYQGMMKFLGDIRINTAHDTADYLTGTYQLWRHSRDYNGHYVKGLAEIGRNERSPAIHVRTLQRFIPRNDIDRLHLTDEGDQHHIGYAFRRDEEKHYIFLLADDPERHGGKGGIAVCILNDFTHEVWRTAAEKEQLRGKNRVFSMKGFVLGSDESSLVFSPIYFERLSNDYPGIDIYMKHIKSSSEFDRIRPNLYKPDEVPPKVLAYLERHKPIFR
jgi:hypothetical protein